MSIRDVLFVIPFIIWSTLFCNIKILLLSLSSPPPPENQTITYLRLEFRKVHIPKYMWTHFIFQGFNVYSISIDDRKTNDYTTIDGVKTAWETNIIRINLPHYHFQHHESHMAWPGIKPWSCDGKLMTNHLSCGIAMNQYRNMKLDHSKNFEVHLKHDEWMLFLIDSLS
jgi:hypothetical protein